MKKLSAIILVLFIGLSMQAQPPLINAKSGMNFGVKTSETNAVASADLYNNVTEKETALKVKGKVVEVCKAEGCWLKMETANGTMMIRMKDHKFMVPVSLSGKTIVAQGTATVKETSVDMLKHYAEDAGKSADEIAKITEPKKEIVMQATGILVL
ncbi:MAG: DUF4920 domain-containing protein [Ferruginibacter sp.]